MNHTKTQHMQTQLSYTKQKAHTQTHYTNHTQNSINRSTQNKYTQLIIIPKHTNQHHIPNNNAYTTNHIHEHAYNTAYQTKQQHTTAAHNNETTKKHKQ